MKKEMEKRMEQNMGQSLLDELDCGEIQKLIDGAVSGQKFDFLSCVRKMVQGEWSLQGDGMEQLRALILSLGSQEKSMVSSLLLLSLMGALIHNFGKLWQSREVSQTSYYLVYLSFCTLLAATFGKMYQMTRETLTLLLDFMKTLLPTYCVSLSFVQGAQVAGGYYGTTLFVITLAEYLLVKVALPAVNLYFVLLILDGLSGENMFSRMAALLKSGVRYGAKTLLGFVLGMNVLQGLIVPLSGQVRQTALVRFGSAIPGVGGTVGAVTQMVLCTGGLVKNALGVAGILAMLWICGIPLIRLLIHQLAYRVVAALTEPVTEKRLISCLDGAAGAVYLLAYILGICSVLLAGSIAILCAATGVTGAA